MSSMPTSLIPPTPSASDYADSGDRPLIPETADPIGLFQQWMAEARAAEPNDSNAMSLATVDADGNPDVRIVLLKGFDSAGFTFFTNLESAKGQHLTAHPSAALGFHWKSLRRQVRIRGSVTRVSDAETDAYFASRAAPSRISAIASDQSRPMANRAVFEQRIAELSTIYGDSPDIPRPDYWGGFRLTPIEIEFWQDQAFRMHDRLKLYRKGDGWVSLRLYP
ncbi:pyridoxamine 5'-phosphate oxidase [Hyphomonas sp.]|uniref:pyridoxamine 5'-phosphate oxidase n=1 Tax=Hyphomonas sp. TaxID=87 RepID=UPI00344077DD